MSVGACLVSLSLVGCTAQTRLGLEGGSPGAHPAHRPQCCEHRPCRLCLKPGLYFGNCLKIAVLRAVGAGDAFPGLSSQDGPGSSEAPRPVCSSLRPCGQLVA